MSGTPGARVRARAAEHRRRRPAAPGAGGAAPASAAARIGLAPYALGERTGLNSTYNTHGEPLYVHSTVNGTDANGSVLPYSSEVPPGGPIVPSAAGGDENALPAGASFHGAPPTAGLDRGTKLARMQQVAGSPAGTAAPFGY